MIRPLIRTLYFILKINYLFGRSRLKNNLIFCIFAPLRRRSPDAPQSGGLDADIQALAL